MAIGPREALGELPALGTGPREAPPVGAAGLAKGLFAAIGDDLGTGPFDAVGEEPGLAPNVLLAVSVPPPAGLPIGSLVRGALEALCAAPASFDPGSLPRGLFAVIGAWPPAFAADCFVRGLLAAKGEDPAAFGEDPAAFGAGALAAPGLVDFAGSSGRVAAGFVGEEISALPGFVAVPAPAAGFFAGVAAALDVGLPAPAAASGFGLAAPAPGSADTSVSSTRENALSRRGGVLGLASGGLLPLVPSTRIAAPHDLHLMVTCFPRTLRL